MDDERKAFEAWAAKTHGNRALSDPDAGSMWSAWQARATLPQPAAAQGEPEQAGLRYFRDAQALAQRFHEAYERLAPDFGYITRPETRSLDLQSANGRLMVAVCQELLAAAPAPEGVPQNTEGVTAGVRTWQHDETGRITQTAECPGPRWTEVPDGVGGKSNG